LHGAGAMSDSHTICSANATELGSLLGYQPFTSWLSSVKLKMLAFLYRLPHYTHNTQAHLAMLQN